VVSARADQPQNQQGHFAHASASLDKANSRSAKAVMMRIMVSPPPLTMPHAIAPR
jgi:hypothetical protein